MISEAGFSSIPKQWYYTVDTRPFHWVTKTRRFWGRDVHYPWERGEVVEYFGRTVNEIPSMTRPLMRIKRGRNGPLLWGELFLDVGTLLSNQWKVHLLGTKTPHCYGEGFLLVHYLFLIPSSGLKSSIQTTCVNIVNFYFFILSTDLLTVYKRPTDLRWTSMSFSVFFLKPL